MSKIKAKRILGACIIASVVVGIFIPAMLDMGFWRVFGIGAAAALASLLLWIGVRLIALSND